MMINYPKFAMDVNHDELSFQHNSFIENRHDQAIYSALIYKYQSDPQTRNKIYSQWEHIEDYDPIFSQAIRATRLRQGQAETTQHKIIAAIKRLIKDYVLKPFYFAPCQIWHTRF